MSGSELHATAKKISDLTTRRPPQAAGPVAPRALVSTSRGRIGRDPEGDPEALESEGTVRDQICCRLESKVLASPLRASTTSDAGFDITTTRRQSAGGQRSAES